MRKVKVHELREDTLLFLVNVVRDRTATTKERMSAIATLEKHHNYHTRNALHVIAADHTESRSMRLAAASRCATAPRWNRHENTYELVVNGQEVIDD